MRQILAITRKEWILWAQKPGSWIIVFVVPFLFIWIIQSVFGSTGTPVVTIYAVNEDAAPGGAQALLALQNGANLKVDELETREEADRRVGAGVRMAAVIIPAGFSDAVKTPGGAKIDIIIDPARSEQASIVVGLVNSALAPLIVDAEVSRGVETSVEQVVTSVSQALLASTRQPGETATITPTGQPGGELSPTVQVTDTITPGTGTLTTQTVSATRSATATFTKTPTAGTQTPGTITISPTAGTQTPRTATVTPGTPTVQPTRTVTQNPSISPTAPVAPTATVLVTETPVGGLQPGGGSTFGNPLSIARFLTAAIKGVVSSQVQEAVDNPQIQVETQPAGGAARKPSLLDYLVPGYSLMFVFFLISSLAVTVVEERQTGTLNRLLVAPITRSQILLGKMLPYFLIAVAQFIVVLAVSKLAFGIDLGSGASGSTTGLGLLIIASAAAMAGLGILVAAFARNEGQADGLAIVLVLAMAVVSGAMFPSISIPGLQLITPHYWAIQGFLNVIARGQGLEGALGPAGILLIMASLFFTIGAIRFRFE